MTITEQTIIDQITVDSSGNINVRRAYQILRDGEVISQVFHRHVLQPGADLTGEDPKVIAIATAAWMP